MFSKLSSGIKALIQMIIQIQIQTFTEFLEQCSYRFGAQTL